MASEITYKNYRFKVNDYVNSYLCAGIFKESSHNQRFKQFHNCTGKIIPSSTPSIDVVNVRWDSQWYKDIDGQKVFVQSFEASIHVSYLSLDKNTSRTNKLERILKNG